MSWYIPPGTATLGKLVRMMPDKFGGPILTTNFDPLIANAVRLAGGNPSTLVLDSDGHLQSVSPTPDSNLIIHLHGFWDGRNTMHTPAQIGSRRSKLKASLERLLQEHPLLVVAYGGWDDVFTQALSDIAFDNQAQVEILWCFYEDDGDLIDVRYKKLLANMGPVLQRGRFRRYGGIDCHTVFAEILQSAGQGKGPKNGSGKGGKVNVSVSIDTSEDEFVQHLEKHDEVWVIGITNQHLATFTKSISPSKRKTVERTENCFSRTRSRQSIRRRQG